MTTPPLPPFRGVEWDDSLEKTPEVIKAITKGHFRVERWVLEKAPTTNLTLKTIVGFHRVMFEEVFPDFAGRIRGPAPNYIPQNVVFGNYRGVQYDDVPGDLEKLIDLIGKYVIQLDSLKLELTMTDFDLEVMKVAAYTHCELIRIHPFVNGNGRTSRTCINYFAARYGANPIPFERPAGEYLDANRTWLRGKNIDHFVDFLRPFWR